MNPPYPVALSEFWRSRAARVTGSVDSGEAVAAFSREAAELSDLLTTGRSAGFGAYARSPRHLVAYGLFLFPRTWFAVLTAVAELVSRPGFDMPAGRPFRLLDLGAGSGASLLAAAQVLLGAGAGSVEATAVERNPESLEVLHDVLGVAPDGLSVTMLKGDLRAGVPRGGGWDLVVLGFSLNEACPGPDVGESRDLVRRLVLSTVPTGHVLLVEPALRETAERLEALRDLLVGAGEAQVWAPCRHQRPCPLRSGAGAWCHEVRPFRPPPELERVNRHLHRDVTGVKFSFLALSRRSPALESPGVVVRLLSSPTREKGKAAAWGCTSEGERVRLEALRRDRAAASALLGRERGDVVVLDEPARVAGGAVLRPRAGDSDFRRPALRLF